MNIRAQIGVVLHLERCLTCRMGESCSALMQIRVPSGLQEGCYSGWELREGQLVLRERRRSASPVAPIPSSDGCRLAGGQAEAILMLRRMLELLPPICGHCLNPSCLVSCRQGALFKRRVDGMVIRDALLCRGLSGCSGSCPYGPPTGKRILMPRSGTCLYHTTLVGNWSSVSPVCTERVCYPGIILYDSDTVSARASTPCAGSLADIQRELLLDPHDPEVIREASEAGLSPQILAMARQSPVFKLVSEWQVALPWHPESRTLPMVWIIPPLAPLLKQDNEAMFFSGSPVTYLASHLSAGNILPVRKALLRLFAVRKHIQNPVLAAFPSIFRHVDAGGLLEEAGMEPDEAIDLFRFLELHRVLEPERRYSM